VESRSRGPAEPKRSPKHTIVDAYEPTSLPKIDAVEIVDIRGLDANRVSQYMLIAGNAPYVRREGESAQPFADAWRNLLAGESVRCHVPPIGLRFFVDGTIHTEASVCWRCNNLFGMQNGIEISYAFDAESAPAQKLLSLSQEAIGIDVVGDG